MATRNVSWTILMDAKTSEQWSQVTTVLPKGYMAIEIGDVTRIKIGDGTKTYADLDYIESNADLTNYYNKTEVDNKIIDAMTKAFILKGTVDSVEALPASDNKVGDLYIVTLEEGNAAEYVWTGTSWEYMGQTFKVDLSGYYTSGEVDALLLTKAAAVHTHTASDVSGLATVATSGSYSDLTGKPTIDTDLSSTSTNAVQNKAVKAALDGKAAKSHTHTATEVTGLATVATSGSYSDLSNTPTIDTALNSTSTNAVQNKVIKAALDGKSDSGHTHSYTDLTDLPTIDSELNASSTNAIQNKVVATAISGLESEISGKSDSGHTHSYSDLTDKPIIDAELSSTSTNAVQNKAVTTALAGKSDTGHTHTASDVTGLATVATSGSYTDLSNKPTIPKVDATLSTTSTNAIQNKAVKTALDGKSDTGHTHTATEVSGLADVATSGSYSDLSDTPTIDTALSATSTNAVQNKVINEAITNIETEISGKANATHTHTASEVSGLATVATSGKYSDLTGRPTIDTALNSTSTNAVQNKVIKAALDGKSDSGHTHSYTDLTDLPTIDSELNASSTNAIQNKVVATAISGLESEISGKSDSGHTHSYSDLTDKPIIDAELSSTSTNAVQNKAVTTALAGKSDTGHTHTASDVTGLATVATSGSYTDLSNKPTIPKVDATLSTTSTNAIQNKAVKTALDGKSDTGHTHTATEVSGLADVATSGSYSDLSDTPTIDTALSATSTNAVQNKVINTALAGKANATHNHTATEVSGLSTVATSGKYSDLTGKPTIPTVDATLSTTSTNAIQNKAVATALNGKANASHTHEMSEITDLADELAKYVQATDTLVINCTL